MAEINKIKDCVVLLRGGGDLASAVAHRLVRSGFQVCIKELESPRVVRRNVAFANAIFEECVKVEGITGRRIYDNEDPVIVVNKIKECMLIGEIPIVTVEESFLRQYLNPTVFIDGTISKKQIEYKINDYPLMIGIGPDIEAGLNVDAVIETERGHNLGRIIYNGEAKKSTGIPGNINGFSHERILRAPKDGYLEQFYEIGDLVEKGDLIMQIDHMPVIAQVSGMIRGLIHSDVHVTKHQKIGDIDPRGESADYLTMSDKARNIAGAVLEVILNYLCRGDR